jgi:hypothetical protein
MLAHDHDQGVGHQRQPQTDRYDRAELPQEVRWRIVRVRFPDSRLWLTECCLDIFHNSPPVTARCPFRALTRLVVGPCI